jgi:hypothetical protein
MTRAGTGGAHRLMGKIEQDILYDRGMQYDVYCGKCAYNLRTRPRLGVCPECGNEYDARPLHMEGILLPKNISLPVRQFIGMLFCVSVTLLALYSGLVEGVTWAYVPAVAFFALAIMYAYNSVVRSVSYFRHRALMRSARNRDR